MRSPWTIHTPRQNSLVVLAWRREKLHRAVTSLSPQAASWPISLEPTSPGRRSPKAEIRSADSMKRPQIGKPTSPALVPTVNPIIVRSSSLSALTAPNKLTNRMLKKSASFVLVSLRGSTYRSVRLTSSLTAAALNGLFEHPAWHSPIVPGMRTLSSSGIPLIFSHFAGHAAC